MVANIVMAAVGGVFLFIGIGIHALISPDKTARYVIVKSILLGAGAGLISAVVGNIFDR